MDWISFFNNPSYATWAQSAIVAGSVAVAIWAVQGTDKNQQVSNSFSFAQKFFLENPSPAAASNILRKNFYGIFTMERSKIAGFDLKTDRDKLYRIADSLNLTMMKSRDDYKKMADQVNSFMLPFMSCVNQSVCDKETAVKLMGKEVWAFYNAACPYIQDEDESYGNNRLDTNQYLSFIIENVKEIDGKALTQDDFLCQETYLNYVAHRR